MFLPSSHDADCVAINLLLYFGCFALARFCFCASLSPMPGCASGRPFLVVLAVLAFKNTGIVEVELPMDDKLRNIEETERAKKKILDERIKGVNSSAFIVDTSSDKGYARIDAKVVTVALF